MWGCYWLHLTNRKKNIPLLTSWMPHLFKNPASAMFSANLRMTGIHETAHGVDVLSPATEP
jgi:hypothetical protein